MRCYVNHQHNLKFHFVTVSPYCFLLHNLLSLHKLWYIWLSESEPLPEYQSKKRVSPTLGLQIQIQNKQWIQLQLVVVSTCAGESLSDEKLL